MIATEEAKPFQHKDYSLKAGEKISVNIGVSITHTHTPLVTWGCVGTIEEKWRCW